MSEELREVYKEGIGEEEEAAGAGSAEVTAETAEEAASLEADEDLAVEVPEFVPFHEAEEDFEKRVKRRKAKIARKKIRRRILLLILIIALFASLATMCGRDIVRLKAENRALQKRQAELEEERDRLKQEVENAGQREYVQDQARKQLRLLNPGELLFTFEDEEGKK